MWAKQNVGALYFTNNYHNTLVNNLTYSGPQWIKQMSGGWNSFGVGIGKNKKAWWKGQPDVDHENLSGRRQRSTLTILRFSWSTSTRLILSIGQRWPLENSSFHCSWLIISILIESLKPQILIIKPQFSIGSYLIGMVYLK